MLPLFDLIEQLGVRGYTITIVLSLDNLPLLEPLIFAYCFSLRINLIPIPSHPSIPPGVENVKDLPLDSFQAKMQAIRQLHDPILHWFRTHPHPPVAIISDMLLSCTQHLACQMGIPSIVFSPSGALALSIINTLWRDRPKRPTNPNARISFHKIPNRPSFPSWQLSRIYRRYVEGDSESEFIRDGFLANMASWGLVLNTSTELERVYVDHLKNELGHDRVWAVGPLTPQYEPMRRFRPSSTFCRDMSVMWWLDTCQDHSVVYVCFGSQVVLTNKQMEVLAVALERSGVRFVWAVKEEKYGTIPDGFEDRVAGRGQVIKGWAPQIKILRHRAVGSFLTHCGWYSVLEGLVAGVPILAWPMEEDQFANATLLVEELKVGAGVFEGQKREPDSAQLAEAIAASVSGSRSQRARAARAKQVGKAALDSIERDGSSWKDLDGLVNHLRGLPVPSP